MRRERRRIDGVLRRQRCKLVGLRVSLCGLVADLALLAPRTRERRGTDLLSWRADLLRCEGALEGAHLDLVVGAAAHDPAEIGVLQPDLGALLEQELALLILAHVRRSVGRAQVGRSIGRSVARAPVRHVRACPPSVHRPRTSRTRMPVGRR